MPTFERAGQAVDKELARLRHFFETEVKPATKRRAIEALRAASRRLARLASDLEARPAAGRKDVKGNR